MITLLFSALYFFLPAAFANMMPVAVKKIPLFDRPVHQKLFGKNKTWRGLLAGYLGALFVLFIQFLLQQNSLVPFWDGNPALALTAPHSVPHPLFSTLNYENINLFLYAFLFGGGALIGDLIKSFFKRRLKIPPGAPFIPFDQIDFILGVYVFFLPVSPIPLSIFITLLIIAPLLHLLTNLIAYKFALKKVWW